MKTFFENLKITKDVKILEHCFILMCQKGIDPHKFVEWIIEEGQFQKNFNEKACLWLKKELNLIKLQEFFTPAHPMQDQAENVQKALNKLHKRMGVSYALFNGLGGQEFMQTILSFIQFLNNDFHVFLSPDNQPYPEEQPQESYDSLSSKEKILRLFEALQDKGVDPILFVEFYKNYLKENILQNAGDWTKNMINNVYGAARRFWTGEQGQFGNEGNVRQFKVNQKRDYDAMNEALHALSQLASSMRQQGFVPSRELENFYDMVVLPLEKFKNVIYTIPAPQPQMQQMTHQQPQYQQPQMASMQPAMP
jgi:uncharacterized protein YukE